MPQSNRDTSAWLHPTRLAGRLSTSAKVNFGFGFGLLLLAVVAGVAQVATTRLSRTVDRVEHTYQVLATTAKIRLELRAAEAAHRGFVATAAEPFVVEYERAVDSIGGAVATLRRLTADNPEQQRRLIDLDSAVQQRVAFFAEINRLRAAGAHEEAETAVQAGAASPLRARTEAVLAEIAAGERRLLAERSDAVERTMARMNRITVAAIILSALLVLLATYLINGDIRVRRRAERELRESELRLRDFLDSASDLIQSNGTDGSLRYVNRSWLRTLGYEEDEVIGRPALDFVAPECREYCIEAGSAIIRNGTSAPVTFTLLRRDGAPVHVSGNSNVRIEDGAAVAIRTIMRDVTKQREVDRLKDEFVSVVSHELRTPLTSIRGSLGLLGGGLLGAVPERAQRMLDLAVANTDRLVRLINDILDVERIESGQAPMVKRRVDLAELTAQTVESVRPLADRAGVDLTLETEPLEANADPDRIVQAITNLVGNAIKFSEPGGTVQVLLARTGNDAHLRVIDGGRGIPADRLESIFERFQQVDATDAREKGGTGLGLAICRTIVQQHDGRVWAESEAGQGSTFHVRLPLLETPLPLSTASLPAAGPLVVVCDDDDSARAVLRELLELRGFNVAEARDGAGALELAVSRRPAAVLLDLLMPGTDGWQTLAALKADPATQHIPVIVVSGVDYDGDAPIVSKPVDAAVLFSEIDRALLSWGGGETVLLVEDDEDLARVLIEFLARHGLRTAYARNGSDAIRLAQLERPALLVLDLMLPDTDGFSVIDWLRRHDRLRDVPIVVYTALDLDDADRARVGVAPDRLLTKARVPPEDLVRRVVSVIGRITWDQHERSTDEADPADRG